MPDEEVSALQAELKELLNSWAYAFAMADPCCMGPWDPKLQGTLDRVAELRVMVAAHG